MPDFNYIPEEELLTLNQDLALSLTEEKCGVSWCCFITNLKTAEARILYSEVSRICPILDKKFTFTRTMDYCFIAACIIAAIVTGVFLFWPITVVAIVLALAIIPHILFCNLMLMYVRKKRIPVAFLFIPEGSIAYNFCCLRGCYYISCICCLYPCGAMVGMAHFCVAMRNRAQLAQFGNAFTTLLKRGEVYQKYDFESLVTPFGTNPWNRMAICGDIMDKKIALSGKHKQQVMQITTDGSSSNRLQNTATTSPSTISRQTPSAYRKSAISINSSSTNIIPGQNPHVVSPPNIISTSSQNPHVVSPPNSLSLGTQLQPVYYVINEKSQLIPVYNPKQVSPSPQIME